MKVVDFEVFQRDIEKHFATMVKNCGGMLFRTRIDKDLMWDTYLSSFPEGTNPVFRERTEHDCNCCKQFVRSAGDIVAVIQGQIVSIWDVETEGQYQPVADALATLIKSQPIADIFISAERKVGTRQTTELLTSATWNHFFLDLPSFTHERGDVGERLNMSRTKKQVLERALNEFTDEAIETVLELISGNSLYRGEEHQFAVREFARLKSQYNVIPEDRLDAYIWQTSVKIADPVARIRGTVIGTLIEDLSTGKDLEDAVKSYEVKVAPTNYRRPNALVTAGMLENAKKTIEELGLRESMERRHATPTDLTINNVIFADRSVRPEMGDDLFDCIPTKKPSKSRSLDRVEEVHIDHFISDILPNASSLELMLENRLKTNLVSLIAPIHPNSTNMFRWGNRFSWAYNGDVADSQMKERVKAAGGDVNGDVRFSIQWNDEQVHNRSDYDAHCKEPGGNEIYFGNKGCRHNSSGMLDVDITNPSRGVPAVENITYSDRMKMRKGVYYFYVVNYSKRDGCSGFRAEVEVDGVTYNFNYQRSIPQGKRVDVAQVVSDGCGNLTVSPTMECSEQTAELWGLMTGEFHPVTMVMNSPNHWDGEETGNRHYFFMLNSCRNPEPARGFFNEYLTADLNKHRKVLEILGTRTKVQYSDEQLSGLGFSTTKRGEVLCKVTGNTTRIIRIKF